MAVVVFLHDNLMTPSTCSLVRVAVRADSIRGTFGKEVLLETISFLYTIPGAPAYIPG